MVIPILDKLLKDYKVVHITGEFDYDILLELKSHLPDHLASNYSVKEWVKPQQMHRLYANTDFAISRAGANTTSELIYCAIPTVYIPIPWSKYDEQTKNAQFAVDAGLGIILNQTKTNSSELFLSLSKLKQLTKVNSTNSKLNDEGAAIKLANLVVQKNK